MTKQFDGETGAEITAHPDFDFSKARPGDVIIITDSQLIRMGHEAGQAALPAIEAALLKAGLGFCISRSALDKEFAIKIADRDGSISITGADFGLPAASE